MERDLNKIMFPRKCFTGVCLLLVAACIQKINAVVEPLEHLPEELQEYLDICLSSGDLSQQSARLVFWTSINQYVSKFFKNYQDLSPQQEAYLENALEDAFVPLFTNVSQYWHLRRKRQASTFPARRIRREIRTMTVRERRRYFAAVNAMKRDRRLPPNVYDFLAAYHSGDTIQRAHFGPAFPSWHRLYLWIFEYFLRQNDPDATIPFWASVLDNDMQDPTQSVIWSPGFFGNGDGVIRTGPFRNWNRMDPQTSFTRNIGGGELYTFQGINRILNRTLNADILIPTAQPDSNFEIQHGASHVFVGGSMNNLNSAARDPIFFSHHSFVDQIWERFRINQRRNGINPETDYPFNENDARFRPQHNPTANAGFAGLAGAETWIQRFGYLNAFSDLVGYEELPECPRCANSPYLFCDRNLRPARCVSRTIAEMRGRSDVAGIDVTPGIRVARQAEISFSQDTSLGVCPRRTFINDVETRWLGRIVESLPVPSSNRWAYIPVKVVSKRPLEYNKFDKYSLYSHKSSAQLRFKDELLKQGLQKSYENCEKFQDAVGKITIVSYGLNYEGYSEEYVFVDNRLGVAEGNGIIPVKMPTGSDSDTIIAAFDSCGRVCTPHGKKRETEALSESMFKGGVRVSDSPPKQFSESYADALLSTWEVPSRSSCPIYNDYIAPFSFFCEFTDTLMWSTTSTHGPQWLFRKQRSDKVSAFSGTGNPGRTNVNKNNGHISQNTGVSPTRGMSELNRIMHLIQNMVP